MSDFTIPVYRTGAEWQEIDEAHSCRYCTNRKVNEDGTSYCQTVQDLMDGITFTPVLQRLDENCDYYDLDLVAFEEGEGRSPNTEEFRYVHQTEIINVEVVGVCR